LEKIRKKAPNMQKKMAQKCEKTAEIAENGCAFAFFYIYFSKNIVFF
jgi:hypothetical protein